MMKQFYALLVLVLSFGFSSMLPAQSVIRKEGSGLTLQACDSRPDYTEPTILAVTSFRTQMLELIREKDLVNVFAQPDVKKDILKRTQRLLGFPGMEGLVEQKFDAILKAFPRSLEAMADIKRVYIYQADELKARLKAGEKIPLFSYDPASGEFSLSWNSEQIMAEGGPADMPIIILIPSEPAKPEDVINEKLGVFGKLLEHMASMNYSSSGYSVISRLISSILDDKLPTAPIWFKVGLQHALTVRVLGELIGTRSAIDAYQRDVPFVGDPLQLLPMIDFEKWQTDTIPAKLIPRYSRVSTYVIMRAIETAGPNWISEVLTRLEKQKKISSNDVITAIKETAAIDVREYVPKPVTK